MSESQGHPTVEQLRGLIAGTIAPRDVAATARHLAACAQCTAVARGAYDVEAAAAAVRKDVMAAPRASRPWMAVAAMIAAAAILGLWLVMRQPPAVPPTAVSAARPEWDALERSALRSGQIARPDILRELRPAPSSLRNVHAEARPTLGPAGVVVESDRPRFWWSAVNGATSYRVLLFTHGSEAARSEAAVATSWQPAQPLARGGVYEWQVIAATPRGEIVVPPPDAPRALFAVLSAASADEIAAARRERPSDTLLLGLLYARAGVVDRAEELLRPYQALHRVVVEWR